MEDIQKDRWIEIENLNQMMELFGRFDENMKLLEEELDVQIVARETQLHLLGDDKSVDIAYTVITKLLDSIKDGGRIDRGKVRYYIQLAKEGDADDISELMGNVVCITHKGSQSRPKLWVKLSMSRL